MSSRTSRGWLGWIAVVAVVGTLAAGALLAFREAGPPERAPRAKAELHSALADREPASPPLTALAIPQSAPAPVLTAAAKPTASATTAEAPANEGVQLDLRRVAEVESQFATDNPPVAESWRMRNQLSSVFDSLVSRGVNLENIECHFRLCRLQLLFGDVHADIDIMRDLFVRAKSAEINQFGQALAPKREYLPDGKVRTIVYLAREGTIDLSE